jgi:hypothetical protein
MPEALETMGRHMTSVVENDWAEILQRVLALGSE